MSNRPPNSRIERDLSHEDPPYRTNRRARRGDADGRRGLVRSDDFDEETDRRLEARGRTRHAGPYAGVGPRGYRPSDERLEEQINDRLTHHPGIDATHVVVRVEDGVVTLLGSIESRRQKRLAADAAGSVRGVRDVNNSIRVTRHWETPGHSVETKSEVETWFS